MATRKPLKTADELISEDLVSLTKTKLENKKLIGVIKKQTKSIRLMKSEVMFHFSNYEPSDKFHEIANKAIMLGYNTIKKLSAVIK